MLADGAGNPAIEHLRSLAAKYGGPVLQIGVATGLFALPLVRDGHEVVGIDLSESMLGAVRGRMTTEPADVQQRLTLETGDMRTLDLGRRFPLVTMPGNVFLYNLTQRDQLATLRAMRRHLTDDGVLVIDIFTPDLRLLAAGSGSVQSHRFRTPEGADYVAEQTVLVEPLTQREKLRMTHRRIGPDGVLGPALFTEMTMRYVYPAEMLLLLKVAKLRLYELVGNYATGQRKSAYDGPQVVVATRGE
ncbi:class I SAM-dependent methyltransferase [Nonomuraea sp. NPDC051941]|uniref:class I SAM-dependent methyltransferase n=1 Tax=Nonomuraea sp. NPDC051941 TaxID=3364373 RepID=UPI0037C9F51C